MIRRLLHPAPELLDDTSPRIIGATAAITFVCLALYGFTVGYWRSPVMGWYVALKMPLLIACTLGCNGLLNGMLGILLGGLGFRQSWLALLSVFATASLILASLAPVSMLLALQFPEPDSPQAIKAHSALELFHVALIAFAGIAGVMSLHRILKARCPSLGVARTTLGCWLLGNGLLGAQFSWIFRPFFGTPGLEVIFLRQHPMQGNFYESVWKSCRRLMPEGSILGPVVLILVVSVFLSPLIRRLSRSLQPQFTP